MTIPADTLWPELEAIGEDTVRKYLAQGSYGHNKVPLVNEWLLRKDEERKLVSSSKRDAREEETLAIAREANSIALEALDTARSSSKSAKEQARWAMWAAIIATIAIIIAAMAYIKNS
jgi:hypothetical protein